MTDLVHLSARESTSEILAALNREGAVIVDSLVTQAEIDVVSRDLTPYLDRARAGGDEFGGFQTTRVGALMARSVGCRELALQSKVNAVCEEYLKPYCDRYQLHFTQAVQIGPGQGEQALHRDRGVWGQYLNRSIETQFSTVWAITDFTIKNGATQIVPGSHLWEADRGPEPNEIKSAVMKPGSVLFYNGSVLHGGGANESEQKRLGVHLHYTLGWLRQEENQYLSCPPEIAKEFSPELRALIGYAKGGYVLGFFSPPVGPGEGKELISPEMLFRDPEAGPLESKMSAEELIRSTQK